MDKCIHVCVCVCGVCVCGVCVCVDKCIRVCVLCVCVVCVCVLCVSVCLSVWKVFFFFWPKLRDMWDLSSQTRDGTLAPCIGSSES